MSKPKISSEGNHIAEALLEAMKAAAERGDVGQVVVGVRGWLELEWKIRPNSRESRAIRYSILKAADVALEQEDVACEKILQLAKLLRDLGWHIQPEPVERPPAEKKSDRSPAPVTEVDPEMGRDLQRLARQRAFQQAAVPGGRVYSPPAPPPLPSSLSRATTIQQMSDVDLEAFRDGDGPSMPSFEPKTGGVDLAHTRSTGQKKR